jgi:recombinational DNA repair ATPase RecF
MHFFEYKRFKEIDLQFTHSINIIAGVNGTCKTSLLHTITNSFKAPIRTSLMPEQKKCLEQINKINHITNAKIETLTKSEKKINSSRQKSGILYKVDIEAEEKEINAEFRRYNSESTDRYRLIPKYEKGQNQNLVEKPTIYLGLSRLYPFGEYDEAIQKTFIGLPDEYQSEINTLYKEKFTRINIRENKYCNMSNIRKRNDFVSDIDGIDSNTISAGEDSVYVILTALVSLRYYNTLFSKSSILLVDEIDATLHPAFQIKLLEILKEYSEKYKIQIFFTTHSFTILEKAFIDKINVIYFIKTPKGVHCMGNPDMNKVILHLREESMHKSFFRPKKIPIFTEDEEARVLLQNLIDYFNDSDKEKIGKISHHFQLVDSCFGGDNLKKLFDNQEIDNFQYSICVLDGDKNQHINVGNRIIALPGKKSPEEFLFEFAKELVQKECSFWRDTKNIEQGYTSDFVTRNIVNKYDEIVKEYNEKKGNKISTKGFKREQYKKLFNSESQLIKLLFWYWIGENGEEVKFFKKGLLDSFCQCAQILNIDLSFMKDNNVQNS